MHRPTGPISNVGGTCALTALLLVLIAPVSTRADDGAAIVHGRAIVLDPLSGRTRPLDRGDVLLSAVDTTRSVRTDARGNYAIVGLSPGTYDIVVPADAAMRSMASRAVTVRLRASDTARIDLCVAERSNTKRDAVDCSPKPVLEPTSFDRTVVGG